MQDYLNKFYDKINSIVIILDGERINYKHPKLIDVVRNLEKTLKQTLVPHFLEAIDVDKVIDILVEDYVAYLNYNINYIFKGRMSFGETLSEKVEAEEATVNEPRDEEVLKEEKEILSKPVEKKQLSKKTVSKKKKTVKKK